MLPALSPDINSGISFRKRISPVETTGRFREFLLDGSFVTVDVAPFVLFVADGEIAFRKIGIGGIGIVFFVEGADVSEGVDIAVKPVIVSVDQQGAAFLETNVVVFHRDDYFVGGVDQAVGVAAFHFEESVAEGRLFGIADALGRGGSGEQGEEQSEEASFSAYKKLTIHNLITFRGMNDWAGKTARQ